MRKKKPTQKRRNTYNMLRKFQNLCDTWMQNGIKWSQTPYNQDKGHYIVLGMNRSQIYNGLSLTQNLLIIGN